MDTMPAQIEAHPEQHAFIMAGTNTLFLCHVTMFMMEEHSYQLILRAGLPDYAMQRYRDDRAEYPDETYFLGNVEQDLWTVPELQTRSRTSFIADIYRGIPERDVYLYWPWKFETPLVKSVPVTVEQVVFCRHFDCGMEYPPSLTYVLFGAGDEAHLSYYATKAPDFDQVASLTEAPAWLPPPNLAAGAQINFPELPQHPCPCASPLEAGKTYAVQYQGQEALYPVEIAQSLWFSTKITNPQNPCRPAACDDHAMAGRMFATGWRAKRP